MNESSFSVDVERNEERKKLQMYSEMLELSKVFVLYLDHDFYEGTFFVQVEVTKEENFYGNRIKNWTILLKLFPRVWGDLSITSWTPFYLINLTRW